MIVLLELSLGIADSADMRFGEDGVWHSPDVHRLILLPDRVVDHELGLVIWLLSSIVNGIADELPWLPPFPTYWKMSSQSDNDWTGS